MDNEHEDDRIIGDSGESPLPISQAMCDELDRRIADYESSPNEGESWEGVRDRLMQRSRLPET